MNPGPNARYSLRLELTPFGGNQTLATLIPGKFGAQDATRAFLAPNRSQNGPLSSAAIWRNALDAVSSACRA
jgi:hypothetical protein